MNKYRNGKIIIVLGLIHTVVGLAVFYEPLRDIVSAGVLNGVILDFHPFKKIVEIGFYPIVNTIAPRMAAFWFLWTGFSWIILGSLCSWIEHKLKMPVPRFIGWALFIYALAGLIVLPLSGFPLLLVGSVHILLTTK